MARYYYRRYWKPRWRRRYRPIWTRRARAPFRRRRRRKRRVRRKLPSISIKQWQPGHINKLTIKGLYCLLQVHKTRYNHDYNQYETSVPVEGHPNGGGFSILRFTLNALWEQHEKAHNVWTKSNKNMPLFRYTGCSIKIYRPLDIDLVVKFQRCYPMSSSKLMFTGSQPSIMMMSKGSKKIRCKRNAPNSKPYKTFYFKPPSQMTNKWYFQHTESNTGLLLMQVSSASFDNYYSSSNAESSTITLYTLNTRIFQNLNFDVTPTYGYMPRNNYGLWASNGEDKLEDLIWLGNSKQYNKGTHIKDFQTTQTNWTTRVQNYLQNPKNWGNPFYMEHLHKTHTLWFGTKQPLLQLTKKTNNENADKNTKCSEVGLNKVTDDLFYSVRYNPFKDKGYNNNIYILPNYTDNEDLNPLPDPDLQNPGFPNWLSCFGFQDYLKKLGKKDRIDDHWIMLWKSNYFDPYLPTGYIFIDHWFLHGDSPEYEGRTDWDNINWYPQIQHQVGELNKLALCGPGAPKLGSVVLAEAKMEYKFHFKIGGCGPPVEKITNPADQPTYATPTNVLDTNSLQSPEEPIETSLYQFDWRRDEITKKATDRITKDFSTSKYLFTDAVSSGTQVPIQQTQQEELLSSEEEETQKETLFEQLQRQRLKQKDLRHRIKLLLNKLQKLE
nr:MAG: ORF1 [TTV-like mini virus]